MNIRGIILALSLVFNFCAGASAQTYIREFITGRATTHPKLGVNMYVGEDGVIEEYVFDISGYDRRYDNGGDASNLSVHITITPFTGSASELLSFLDAIVEFADKYKKHELAGTSIYGTKTEALNGVWGQRIRLYDGDAYFWISKSQINSYRKGLLVFCEEKGIELPAATKIPGEAAVAETDM